MRKCLSLTAIAIAALLSGCGLQNQINNLKNDRDALTDRVELLETQASLNIASITSMHAELSGLQAEIAALKAARDNQETLTSEISDTLDSSIAAAVGAYNSLAAVQGALQQQTLALQAQVAALQAQASVVSIVDPCGPSGKGFDEVLFKMSSGQLVAFFEDKGNRRMTILTPGDYQTTDGSKCQFSVNAQNELTNQRH